MNDFNWRDHIDIKYARHEFHPDIASAEDADPNLVEDLAEKRALLEQALDELSQTPEGRELIREAAENCLQGRAELILTDFGNLTMARRDGRIFFANDIDKGRYFNQGEHDFSIQRILFHELFHLTQDLSTLRHNSYTGEYDNTFEKEAIEATNEYMRKYYNEIPRDAENYNNVDLEGTEDLDFNQNFNPEGYLDSRHRGTLRPGSPGRWQRLREISGEANLSPETQSLIEVSDNPEMAQAQINELGDEGLKIVDRDIRQADFAENAETVSIPQVSSPEVVPEMNSNVTHSTNI